MYVSNLAIDRFGVCSDLSIDSLAPGLNVIHGARESGKTTVVDFLRAVLHGFDSELRNRYLPTDPRQFGGKVTLQSQTTRRTIRRYDNGHTGRLAVENELGFSDEPASLRELYGQVSPQLVEQVFALDFERPVAIDRTLDLAARAGLDLQDRGPDAAQLLAAERDLADSRQRLASLPELHETWELLSDRRRRLVDEIATLETRERRYAEEHDRERTRRTALVVDLERQLADVRREATALDASLSRLLERRRLLEVDLATLRGEDGGLPWQEELRSLDAQLDRWRRTLRDLAVAKNGGADEIRDSHKSL